jgi:hypothetical protein
MAQGDPEEEEIAEIALLGDEDTIDAVDTIDESWAPGESPSGLPADEVLQVHSLTASEPSADELDVGEDAGDLPAPDDEESLGDEQKEVEQALDEALHRNRLGRDLEVRYEEFDAGPE